MNVNRNFVVVTRIPSVCIGNGSLLKRMQGGISHTIHMGFPVWYSHMIWQILEIEYHGIPANPMEYCAICRETMEFDSSFLSRYLPLDGMLLPRTIGSWCSCLKSISISISLAAAPNTIHGHIHLKLIGISDGMMLSQRTHQIFDRFLNYKFDEQTLTL